MRISMTEAARQLPELARLADQGEEIVLVQDGYPDVRLTPTRKALSPEQWDKAIREIQRQVKKKNLPASPDAARSQDFLYDEYGLPK